MPALLSVFTLSNPRSRMPPMPRSLENVLISSFLCLASLLPLAVGCGSPVDPNRPARVPAVGTITYRGVPLDEATVIFSPRGSGHGAVGRTDGSGKFELQTFDPGDGAVPGDYLVTVRKFEIDTQGASDSLAAGGSDDDSDMVGGEVPRGGDGGGYEPKPAIERSLIPEKYTGAASSGLEATVSAGVDNDFRFELVD